MSDASHKSVPEWAEREFCKRANLIHDEVMNDRSYCATALRFAVKQGAKLIAEHEEAPVDPLVKEAREIVAETYERLHPQAAHLAASARAGEFDHHFAHEVTFTAIRRGIEIGGAK